MQPEYGVITRLGALVLASLLLTATTATAEEAKGWDRTLRSADYLEPAIPHPEQNQAALDKLRDLETKTGRKPNILIILVDDMGYGDPGAFGGGEMAGAPTPNIDRLAAGGQSSPRPIRRRFARRHVQPSTPDAFRHGAASPGRYWRATNPPKTRGPMRSASRSF